MNEPFWEDPSLPQQMIIDLARSYRDGLITWNEIERFGDAEMVQAVQDYLQGSEQSPASLSPTYPPQEWEVWDFDEWDEDPQDSSDWDRSQSEPYFLAEVVLDMAAQYRSGELDWETIRMFAPELIEALGFALDAQDEIEQLAASPWR